MNQPTWEFVSDLGASLACAAIIAGITFLKRRRDQSLPQRLRDRIERDTEKLRAIEGASRTGKKGPNRSKSAATTRKSRKARSSGE